MIDLYVFDYVYDVIVGFGEGNVFYLVDWIDIGILWVVVIFYLVMYVMIVGIIGGEGYDIGVVIIF